MKNKKQLILLVVGLIFLICGALLLVKRVVPVTSESQLTAVPDWMFSSGGNLSVTVTYPKTIESGKKNLITVTFQADSALEKVLANGVVFDAQLDMIKSVIQPQKRVMTAVEKGLQTFTWEVEPFNVGTAQATVLMALADKSVSGNYAITAQKKIDFTMEIVESSSKSGANLTTFGLIAIGSGILCLAAAFLFQKRSSVPVKKSRR